MFIRPNHRKKGNHQYCSYTIVESERTPEGSRQRTVLTLGTQFEVPRERWRDLIRMIDDRIYGTIGFLPEYPELVSWADHITSMLQREQARKQPKLSSNIVTVDLDSLEASEAYEVGTVTVGHYFWNELGLPTILENCGLSKRYCTLAEVKVLNSLIDPKSENATPDWVRGTALGELLDQSFKNLVEDPLYRVSDALLNNKVQVEKELYARERNLFSLGETIVLYDLTSTYFEGAANGNPKAKRGYSRDKRGDCKQVCVGLVLDREGFVVAHEVFEGNRRDTTTVGEMLDALERRVGHRVGTMVVVDRGMAYAGNLELIRQRGYDYLVAALQKERDVHERHFLEGNWSPVKADDPQPEVHYQLRETETELHLLCKSVGRQAKDRAIRERAESKLLSDLERLRGSIQRGKIKKISAIERRIGRLQERYPRVARYYQIDYKDAELRVERQDKGIRRAEDFDGTYLLRTNRKGIAGPELWHLYTMLTRVEKAFEYLKSDLGLHPNFHQKEERVEGHIFISILAYHLLHAIEYRLRGQDDHRRWSTIRKILSQHQRVAVKIKDVMLVQHVIWKNVTPTPDQKEIYRRLSIKPRHFPPRLHFTSSSLSQDTS